MTAVVLAEHEPPPAPPAPPEPPPKLDYYQTARTPVAGLLFVLPLLALYEAGIGVAGSSAVVSRNAADAWMRWTLTEAGVSRPWALPAAVVGTLAAWQLTRHLRHAPRPTVDGRLMVGMLTESTLAAWGLVLCGQALGLALRLGGLMSLSGSARNPADWAAACLGAGLYEETLFRLWGLPATYAVLRGFLVPTKVAAGLAVFVTSLAFAAAHYLGGGVENTVAFWHGFGFRFAAGLAFAGLLLTRGFGVAVGAHVIYDATVLLLAAA